MPASGFTNVIVTYNSSEDVLGLLADLRDHAPGIPTTVVDNASDDGTAGLVQDGFPEVRLICNSENVGYARAVNQGISLSQSPYVFLLNPDIRIASSSVFEALLGCLDSDPGVAVAGPLQFKAGSPRPHLNFTWSYLSPQALGIYLAHLLSRPAPQPGSVKVAFLNAGCLFIRRSAFEAVGCLNEKYFLYGEEPDLFLKLIRHGYECRLLSGIAVEHAREKSLRTLPLGRRLRRRFDGVRNIADALLRGCGAILVDRLTGRRPA